MAVTADRVVVELEARLGKYEANVARAERNFDRSMSGIQKAASRTEAIVSRAAGVMGAALSGISVLALARGLMSLSDTAKTLDAQLRLATRTSGSFSKAQDDVRRVAAASRSELAATATLYGNFQRNSRELGISQEEAARATETVAKAFKISGASQEESAQGTRQLVQALQSGVLRGDEFNTMAEAAPRLQKLLADSLGVTQGRLREMAEEGELTSDNLTRAFTDKKFTAGLDAEFRELPVTFDDAMTQVTNAAIITFGAFDRGGQFSQALANFVSDGGKGFAELEKAAEEFGTDTRTLLEGLSSVWEPLVSAGRDAFAALGIDARNTADMIGDYFGFVLGNAQGLVNGLPGANLSGKGYFEFGDRYKERREDARRRLQSQLGEQRLTDSFRGRDALGNPIASGPAPTGAAGKKTPGARKRTGRGGASAAERLAERQASELARLEQDELRARLDLSIDVAERADIQKQLLEAERSNLVRKLTAAKALTPEMQGLIDTIYGLPGKTDPKTGNIIAEARPGLLAQSINRDAEREQERLASDMVDRQRSALEAEAGIAETRADRLAIERRILDLMEAEEKSRLESRIAAGEVADAEKARAALAREQTARRTSIERDAEGPLARYRRDLGNPDRAVDEVEQAVIGELEAVRDGISSAVQKTLGVKNPILAALLNSFIEQQLIKPFVDGLARTQGGGGGLIGGILSVGSSLFGFAGGGSGIVGGRGGTDRNTLSLNGVPFANVSRGEPVHVGSKALGGRGSGATVIQNITVDARNSVNPTGFARDLLSAAGRQAAQAAGAMGQTVMKAVPGRMSQYGRDGF